ncbi:MAG: F0F1 ATP synthase subunit A [Clostridia bacterium]|nr:F0F1 ATP synthase subunit A [Clostridia bacterium]
MIPDPSGSPTDERRLRTLDKKDKKRRTVFLIVWLALIAGLLAAILILGLPDGKEETIREVMRDGVLHEKNRISLFGLEVNPGLVSAFCVTGLLLTAALLIRIFAIPRFKTVPGRFQALLEKATDFFSEMAGSHASRWTAFAGAYIFSAGIYIFFSTVFELFGFQAVGTEGQSVTLPAPIADINGAIAMGGLSFLVILGAGLAAGGPKGGLRVLKDFSLPISMSFRLFGALLSGLLVTELVYYYTLTSFVLPVIVGVLFTLMHAVIQAYVLTTLVSIFYGEAVEVRKKKSSAPSGVTKASKEKTR